MQDLPTGYIAYNIMLKTNKFSVGKKSGEIDCTKKGRKQYHNYQRQHKAELKKMNENICTAY